MKAGLLGEKLGHSFSKWIHANLGDYTYENFEVRREDLCEFMLKKNFDCLNVTIPYKSAVIPYLQEISPEAQSIGSVNTVLNRGGKLCGFNTDLYGMTELIKKAKIDLAGKNALILGTGGTAKMAITAAEKLGAAHIVTVSRTPGERSIGYSEAMEHFKKKPTVILNTTPVGMYPNIFARPIETENFEELSGVVDAVFNPLRTELVQCATRQGVPTAGGLYMLVAQAVRASELFTGRTYAPGTTDRIFKTLMGEKENIVLIGMPSCGKSSVGARLAKLTGRKFFDCDIEIEKRFGKAPAQIIREEGEPFFRDCEEQIVKKLSVETGCVIAAGGGTVLRYENIKNLKKNGKVVFIDRSPDKLTATADRPLSNSAALIRQRYAERYDLYCSSADLRICGNGGIDETAKAILSALKGAAF